VPAAISAIVIVPIFIWLTGKWSEKAAV